MTLSKSTRGIQQEEVWAAADDLIGEGLRPTIERVRLKLGRGSPNTVSPLLDAWFATLGTRLGVGTEKRAADGVLPAPVRQAVNTLWETALLAAQTLAEQALEQAQQALAAQHTVLAQQESDLARRAQDLQTRQTAQNEVLQLAHHQIADLSTRLTQAQALTQRRDDELVAFQFKFSRLEAQGDADTAAFEAKLARLEAQGDANTVAFQGKLARLEAQGVANQRRLEEETQRHAQERRQLEAHASTTERRLMTELDRERQLAKALKLSLQQSEQQADSVAKQAQADKDGLAEKLQTSATALQAMAAELRAARQALALATERADELRGLLDVQRSANDSTIAQLSLLLMQASPKAAV